MLTCMICNQQDDTIIKMPCCENGCHIMCGIKFTADSLNIQTNVICFCGHILYEPAYLNQNSHVDMDDLNNKISVMKKKSIELKKAIVSYNRVLQSKKHTFMSEIMQSKTYIITAKKMLLNEIKETPEYKKTRSLASGLHTLYTRFKHKYGNSYNYGTIIDNIRIPGKLLYWSPMRVFRRLFRLRL